ncbi:PTS beta-glucoside transporter subunit IIBCA [Listeria ivanovii]|uniref:Putative phosphotransferase system (PTS) beta-glucoside-specific enzyme IIABC n=2 Tax=Listeria ivanovii TaxID=1638 RepID=G2ZE93_LISIP|nr:PTS beta-glucoside transporter subunit IIBCA [Listeria ivanovii]MBC1758294.1 PTS beta-glucoside transporter subunit IIBCA [Listeria ivanovii]MBK3913171.1 PTS beta-glucoside transporter subunit IIBCA [Listeria ivanovii subsp. ivanovii]MBK3920712.1 PTS beta-glucoside transporter subunit IIBCA [Listeria ivanovii subsp. ivanovii]MBK3925462.1 PTS beta-glucoside transporter subunit IIBCA [Listeria ivanovii subsp. ivanovii]MCJ1716226.1 PTS beta-glucoside transporter subunit IIBCA [Listeria ivanovi
MNNSDLAKAVVKLVGGKENILSVIHCVTRLRFKLRDENLADTEKIKALQGVMTVVKSGGQYQVVIGDHVSYVYDEVIQVLGIKPDDALQDDSEQEHKSIFNKFVELISGIFMPVLGLMAASGILKGFLTAAVTTGLIDTSAGIYEVLYAASDALFYFMPIILGFSAGKVFKTNQYLSAAVGASLVYPTLVEMYSNGAHLTFLHIPVILMNYTMSVIPVILAIYFMSKLEKVLVKFIPKSLQLIFVPLLLLLIVVPVSLIIIGPVSTYASQLLAKGALALYSLSPMIAGFFLAGVWQVAVMFGLHWAFIPIFINNITVLGYDPINAMLYCTVFAQTGAVMAVMLKTRNQELRSLSVTATISGFLGITEPAIYGVNLPYKKPFIMACVGSAFGGAIAGMSAAKMFGGFASGGVFGIPMFINPDGIGWDFWGFLISLVVAFSIALILTYFFGFKDKVVEEVIIQTGKVATLDETIYSPLQGELMALNDVKDEVFSGGIMGAGVAILPTNGEIRAPFDGTVLSVFKTKHAIGLISKQGVELLIHVGLDTVNLNGHFFDIKVSESEEVKKGDLLGTFDLDEIKKAGYDTTTPVIVTNSAALADVITLNLGKNVDNNQKILEAKA